MARARRTTKEREGASTALQSVLNSIAQTAARLCDARDSRISLLEGNELRLAAFAGKVPLLVTSRGNQRLDRTTPQGHAILDRRIIHVRDMQSAVQRQYPGFAEIARASAIRTFLVAPMIRGDSVLGAIHIRRDRVKVFTSKQIALLQTFADQAAIAIENARLSEELGSRNRELTAALEQQTASSEILKAISGAQTDATAVFESIAGSAVRLCGAFACRVFRAEGEQLPVVGEAYETPEARVLFAGTHSEALGSDSPSATAIRERRVVHYADVPNDPDVPERYRERARARGYRALMAVPMVRDGVALGSIAVARQDPVPFSGHHVELLKTFADQAVIAIENVRLFTELQARNRDLTGALDQQTATSEILRVISSSPTDAQPVFDGIVHSALRLLDGRSALVLLVRGDELHLAALTSVDPASDAAVRANFPAPLVRAGVATQVVRTGQPYVVADIEKDPLVTENIRGTAPLRGYRSMVHVPILRDASVIGVISVTRRDPGAFSGDEVELLQTFADQAVIAIENVRLFTELQRRNRKLSEALEQQTATAQILGAIAGSPTDVQPVLDAVAESAARLCGANDALIMRVEGNMMRRVAHVGPIAVLSEARAVTADTPSGLAIVECRPVHVPDILEAFARGELLETRRLQDAAGFRTILSIPLVREGTAIGVITIRRLEARPFMPAEIALVKTFADQAVIAIENVRLFKELQEKNEALTSAHARVSEALDQQTATSEILRVISRSPTDYQPVFDAIVRNATTVCGAFDALLVLRDGDGFVEHAHYGPIAPARGKVPLRGTAAGQAILEARSVHVEDLLATDEFPVGAELARQSGYRTVLSVPLLREGVAIGAIAIRRTEVRKFSDKQVALLQTFGDQAVIAIENVRLFKELEARNAALTEALAQQTATSEVLRVISQSQTDIQPVFDKITESAARLCDGVFSQLSSFDGEMIRLVATHNWSPEALAVAQRTFPMRPSPDLVTSRAILQRTVVHVPDVWLDPSYETGVAHEINRTVGYRSVLAVPLLRDGVPLGVIGVARAEAGPFADNQIALLQTFADQAVIAIENVRLFTELQARTKELTRSVEQLTALGEVGQAVSSTLELETVLTTIASRASQLAGTRTCTVYEYDEAAEEFHLRATHNVDERVLALTRVRPIRKGEGVAGRVAETLAPVQIEDITTEGSYQGMLKEVLLDAGVRAVLAVPLLRETRLIGSLIVTRNQPGRFADEVVTLLQTFATQSAIAIQNARLFRELAAKGRELAEASRHKSQFLANMSHELRTPMNAILGYTELIADGIYGPVPDKMRDVLTRVEGSGRHLLGLINDVLDLSKIEAGQLTLTLADYAMKEVVEAVTAAAEPLAAAKSLRFIVDVAPGLPTGRGDQRRLAQVLLNLVGNAIKFTDAGHVALRIGVAADLFTIAVSDTGPGIAPADQERIFEEFQQADTSTTRPKGGTGLGLAIARRIVAMHGGRLWVESVLGEGATFRLTLPVRTDTQVREVTA